MKELRFSFFLNVFLNLKSILLLSLDQKQHNHVEGNMEMDRVLNIIKVKGAGHEFFQPPQR